MPEKLTKHEVRTEAKGLSLKELEAQAGELLPDRLEMSRRHPFNGFAKRLCKPRGGFC